MVNLRAMLRRAVTAGVMSREAWNNIVVNKLRDKSQPRRVFLREDEIIRLYRQPCASASMELAHDIFVLECLTGQRIGDTLSLALDDTAFHIGNHVAVVNVVQQKTHEMIKVDVVWSLAVELLEKWRTRRRRRP